RRRCHIVTLEDPIEYVFTPQKAVIDQREIGRDSASFHEALRRVFRQDPDVIMVGEMRDLETISSAITAAETGHLVLATLHTQDAPGTIDRIIDIFPPHQQNQIRTQLANILVGICSQQLLNTTDKKRILATEVLVANYAVRNLVKEGKPQQIRNIMATCTNEGMMLMEHSLASLCKKGKITRETAFLHAFDVKDLERFLDER
ncbi:MAG: twitching motility protein PilT, partial [Thermovirga sp.]|nr:twitching motility protein PilT [Thermovirga sp.]